MSKIPSHASRVFRGQIFDVYQWEQEMFDGSKKTFEALKRPNTVVVLPIRGDTVFYAKQEQPGKPSFVSLFGGRAEEGEDPLVTAKRELLEETGLESDDWKLLRSYPTPGKIDWTIYYFVARNCRKVAEQNLDAGEKISIHETTLDKFFTEIMLIDGFNEHELKKEVMSAYNVSHAEDIKKEILRK